MVLDAVGFGFGCELKLATMSAPGLDLPSLLPEVTAGVNFGLDHKPVEGEAVPLGFRLLCI
tara:strand:- start:33262 stop:33444 length:183 start_codon:yes stop_codon:yes gene_type:complete